MMQENPAQLKNQYDEDAINYPAPWTLWECALIGSDQWTRCNYPIKWNKHVLYRRRKTEDIIEEAQAKTPDPIKDDRYLQAHAVIERSAYPERIIIIPSGWKDRYHVIVEDPEYGNFHYTHKFTHKSEIRDRYDINKKGQEWTL